MTRMVMRVVIALLAASLLAVPASAYKLVAKGKAVAVAKSGLTVTPAQDWNRMQIRPGRAAESWTLDGLGLNDITFYGGIINDATLFREVDKINRPLPHFSSTMLPTDIAQLLESSYRIANNTSLMEITTIEPARFAGADGIHFTYSFTIQNEEVHRLGDGWGAIIGGQLYLITYEAPSRYFYERDLGAFRAMIESASVVAPKK